MVFIDLFKKVPLEPVYMLFYFIETSSNVFYSNLCLQKTCRYNQLQEPKLNTKCDNEKAGIMFVAFVNSWIKSVDVFVMITFSIFASTWSEKSGKKRQLLILLPLVGLAVESFMGLWFSKIWSSSALLAAWIQTLSHAFNGGRVCFFLTSNMYMSDITDEKNRTFRFTMLTMLRFMAIPMGNAVSGILLSSVGFFYSFLINFFLCCIGVSWILFYVKDREIVVNKVTIWESINPKTIFNSVKIIFRKRPKNKRTVLVLLLIVNFLVTFLKDGELTVLYLYFRYKFHWDARQFGIYSAYQNIGIFIGLLFSSILLSKYLQIHDGIIGAFAAFWDIVAALCYMCATQTWHLYLIPLMDILHGAAFIVVKSFLTKVIDQNELGYLTSVIGLTCYLTALSHTVYNKIFEVTMDVFPGSFYVVSLTTSLLVCALYGISYMLIKRDSIQQTITSHTS